MSDKRYPCGLCHYEFLHGAAVCQGCQGTIVYGATMGEIGESAKQWAMLFGALAVAVLVALPFMLNSSFNMHLPIGWGIGFWNILLIAAAGVWGNYIGTQRAHEAHRGQIRTFRRMH